MNLIASVIIFVGSFAQAELCNPDQQFCANDHHHSSSSDSHPTSSSSFNFNPSTVPISRGFGIEFIYFKGVDFALVTGTGRIGAAISPANSDETFFGAPAFEASTAYQDRKSSGTKYPSQKYTLATAFNIFDNQAGGLAHKAMNLGVMAKYNTQTQSISPGTGISGLMGPLSFSYAIFRDQSSVDLSYYTPLANEVFNYQIQTYSAGLSLGSLSLDYSVLNLSPTDSQLTGSPYTFLTDATPAIVSVATATLFYKSCIYTFAARQEDSNRQNYNFSTQNLETQRIKNEFLGSLQVVLGQHVFVGAFYNYYLLRELSAGLTLFF